MGTYKHLNVPENKSTIYYCKCLTCLPILYDSIWGCIKICQAKRGHEREEFKKAQYSLILVSLQCIFSFYPHFINKLELQER